MSSTNYKSVHYRFGTESIKDDDSSEYGLHVVNFYGEESISRPYWFRLNLTSRDPNLDPQDFVNLPGRLSIIRGDQTSYLHGIVSSFELCGRDGDWFMYRAMLSPRLWALSLTHQSRAFQNRSVPEIVRTILEEHGVPHKIDLRASYPSKQYVVQYNETDLAFISRLLAHDGIRYSFVQEEQREVMHLFDSRGQDPWVEGSTEVTYRLPDGMLGNSEHISEFILREQAVPGKVVLRDYNFRDQHADLTTEKETKKKGIGEVYEYGSHYKDRAEGDRLIKVRQEEIDSQQRLIAGRSSCIGFRSGHRFTLTNHHRDDLNEDYLLVRVRHFGGQEQQFGIAGARDNDNSGLGQDYRNEFGCAPALVSFRTPRLTIVNNFFSETFFEASFESRFSPMFNRITGDTIINIAGDNGGTDHGKFYGLMTANVVGDGPYAAVDENGDYLAKMPFDRKGEPSRPLRLAQPYAGPGEAGFHYPAHAGNEVVFACVDGDPDRPLALGFVPNPDHPSPVTSENSSQHVFRTTSDNKFIIEDLEDNENILLYTPHGHTTLSMGNDESKEGILMRTDNHMVYSAGKSGVVYASEGLVLATHNYTVSDHNAYLKAWIPALKTLLKIIISAGLEDPRLKREIKTFKGNVKTAIKSNIKTKYKVDIDALQNILEDIDKTSKSMSDLVNIYDTISSMQDIAGNIKGFVDAIISDKSTPEIFMTSQGNIRLMSKSAISLNAGKGASISAKDALNLVSSGKDVSITAGDGASMKAAKKVTIEAKEDAMTLDAKKSVSIKSSDDEMLLRSKNNMYIDSLDGHVILRAEGSKSHVWMAGQEIHASSEDEFYILSDKEIILECGESKMTLKKNGDINISGNNIVFEGKKEVQLKTGGNVVSVQQKQITLDIGHPSGPTGIEMNNQKIHIDSVNVDVEAKVKASIKGTMVDVDAKGIATVKGSLAKIN